MIESYWPVWLIIGVIFFIEGHRLNRLQDRVDALDLFMGNRATRGDLQELQRKVEKLEKELEKLRDGAV